MKLVKENINDILKPKSKKEIQEEIQNSISIFKKLLFGENYPSTLKYDINKNMDLCISSNKNLASNLDYRGIKDIENIISLEEGTVYEEHDYDEEIINTLELINNVIYSPLLFESNFSKGILKWDGSKVIKFKMGLIEGFIARKEWIR